MRLKNVQKLILICMLLFVGGQEPVWAQDFPLDKLIATIKGFNFTTTSIGILSEKVSDDVVQQLVSLQTAPPRSLRIYLTQSNVIWEVFDDFTFLVNNKKVDAIVIWPADMMNDPSTIKKICTMSKRKKIPVIALQPEWLAVGATAYIEFNAGVQVHVNEQIRSILNYPIAEQAIYQLIKQ